MAWVRGQTIGHGSFATVSLATPTGPSSSFPPLMAVKSCGVSQAASLMKERMILDQLKDCPEIINCYGDCVTVENGERIYNVVLEYASGGDLAGILKNSENFRLPEFDVRRYTKSILKGLKFVHQNGFVHCDIKLQNILLVPSGGHDAVLIADFGLAKKMPQESNLKSKYEIRGTPMYLAPETVAGGEQGPASDIWALGCLVSEMFAGKPVWSCSGAGDLLMKIGVGTEIPEVPGKLSDAGKDFLGKCFVKDPVKRWTAEMLLDHPFMNGVDQATSVSPKNPFDFPDWELENSLSATSFSLPEFECWAGVEAAVSPASRVRQLVTNDRPDWSVTSSWVTVRTG